MQGSTQSRRARAAKKARVTASTALGAMCAICLLGPSAAAAGTLDQQQTISNGGFAISSSSSVGQTFTAGLTGGLDQVDLALAAPVNPPTQQLTIEIRNVSGTVPGAAVLASRSLSVALTNTFQFVPINFPTAIPVTAGAQYSIVAHSSTVDTAPYSWAKKLPGAYAPGNAANAGGPAVTWTPSLNEDMVFRTYVVTPPAPPALTSAASTPAPTGQRAAALKKCKEKHGAKRKKCKKRARLLPV